MSVSTVPDGSLPAWPSPATPTAVRSDVVPPVMTPPSRELRRSAAGAGVPPAALPDGRPMADAGTDVHCTVTSPARIWRAISPRRRRTTCA